MLSGVEVSVQSLFSSARYALFPVMLVLLVCLAFPSSKPSGHELGNGIDTLSFQLYSKSALWRLSPQPITASDAELTDPSHKLGPPYYQQQAATLWNRFWTFMLSYPFAQAVQSLWRNFQSGGVVFADAWWDEGHMLVGAVARLSLKHREVVMLEQILLSWETEYPGMCSIPTAAIWPDHIKCEEHSLYCEGLFHYDAIELFNNLHYISIPYNPQSIPLSPLYQLYPLPNTGASWLLHNVVESLRLTDLRRLPASSNTSAVSRLLQGFSNKPPTADSNSTSVDSSINYSTSHIIGSCPSTPAPDALLDDPALNHLQPDLTPWASSVAEKPNRHTVDSNAQSAPYDHRRKEKGRKGVGSPLSLNLHLRLLLHVFGDVHQPLHCIDTFSTVFEKGDLGGTEVAIKSKDPLLKGVKDLHALWDSAGGVLSTSWPEFSSHESIAKARRLMEKYPKSAFGHRVAGELDGVNIKRVIQDSYRVAVAYVFSEFPWNNLSPDFFPYQPSERYVRLVQGIAEQQIVLGGYRLANVLRSVLWQMENTEFTATL